MGKVLLLVEEQPERFKRGSIPCPALLSVFYLLIFTEVNMVQCEKKEIVDFLNKKADTITNFVQAQEELSNVENIWFNIEEEQAYCYVKLNEEYDSFGLQPLIDTLCQLGLYCYLLQSVPNHTLKLRVGGFYSSHVVVRRNYQVVCVEAAVKSLEDSYSSKDGACIDYIDECLGDIAEAQCGEDIIYGGEMSRDVSPSHEMISGVI